MSEPRPYIVISMNPDGAAIEGHFATKQEAIEEANRLQKWADSRPLQRDLPYTFSVKFRYRGIYRTKSSVL